MLICIRKEVDLKEMKKFKNDGIINRILLKDGKQIDTKEKYFEIFSGEKVRRYLLAIGSNDRE